MTKVMNKNIPKLRFKEFNDEWQTKKLGEVAKINPNTGTIPNNFIYIDLESVENGELKVIKNITINEAPSRAQRVLQKNDILYQTVRPYQRNNLLFKYEGKYVASTGYAQIRTINNVIFLYQYLHLNQFVNTVLLNCTGTSYPAINSSDLSKIPISFPTQPEQEKIADFLTVVDEKLEKMKEKKQNWEQYKKGIMQKIFSQEIRFKDHNGNNYPDWEEKRLGEVCEKQSSNVSANKIEDNIGKYIIYGASGILKKIDYYLSEEEYISIVKDGAGIGRVLYCQPKSSVLSTLDILKPLNNLNIYFLYCLLSNINFLTYSKGTTIPHLYFNDYKKEIIHLPSYEEQTKIADYLSSIDEKIEQINSELIEISNWKKGLLQQMFV